MSVHSLILPITLLLASPALEAREKSHKNMPVAKNVTTSDVSMGLARLPSEFDSVAKRRDANAATRYSTIKIAEAAALNEVEFWSHQLSEHALFLHLGLEKDDLKTEGKHLHNKFEAFRKKLSAKTMHEVLSLAKELRAYKIKVLTRLNSGEWIGWIFPLFARHVILELDYFIDKLNGIKYSDKDEIAFWNVINGEHAGFAAHLLDPSERALFEKADAIQKAYEVESEREMFLKISLKHAKELDAYNRTAQSAIKANKVKSVISPVLIDHVVREGNRSLETLNRLSDKTGAIYPPDVEA